MPETRDITIQYASDALDDTTNLKIALGVEIPMDKVTTEQMGFPLDVPLRVRLLGEAATVTVTNTTSPTPPTPTPPIVHVADITVEMRRSVLEMGPEGIAFKVTGFTNFDTAAPTGTFDARLHDIQFYWTFDDAGSTFSRPLNVLPQHRDANVAYGYAVAHTFDPGTYNVSCLAYEPSSGKTALYEQQIVVKDITAEAPGAQTIYLAPSGDFSNAPAGAQTVTRFRDAIDLIDGKSTPHRILCKRGDTTDLVAETSSSKIGFDFRYFDLPNVWVESESGPGAKHIITCGVRGYDGFWWRDITPTAGALVDVVFKDINFLGPWDAATETAPGNQTKGIGSAIRLANSNDNLIQLFSLIGCDFSGWGLTLYNDESIRHFHMDGIEITNWRDYGYYGYSNWTSLLGSRIIQKTDALSGGTKDQENHNNHGPMRLPEVVLFIMDASEMYSRNGWFENYIGTNTIQPCIRLYSKTRDGDAANLQRSYFEGGMPVVAFLHANTNNILGDSNSVMERCYVMGSHMTRFPVATQMGGVTIRHNILVTPNVPRFGGIFEPDMHFAVANSGLTTGNELARILVEHNTMVNLMTNANDGEPMAAVGMRYDTSTSVVERNNLLHAPNLTPSSTPHAPLDDTQVGTPYEGGYRPRRIVHTGTLAGDVAPGQTLTVTYASGDGSWYEVEPNAGNYFQTRDTGGSRVRATPENGRVSIAHGGATATLTNTGTATWASGEDWELTLDRKPANLPPLQAQYATPASTFALFRPQTGSSAIGAGDPNRVRRDMFGNVRPTNPTLGAMEPA